MKNLVLSSIILLLLSSCSFNVFNGYHKIEKRKLGENELKPLFYGDTSAHVFNTKINILKNYFSGLMVIKPMRGGSYRVIFMTEIGLTIFDMEFFNAGNTSGEKYKLHYCFEALNRGVVTRALGNDIGLMLMNYLPAERVKILSDQDNSQKIFKLKDRCRHDYYFYEDKTNRLSQIMQSSSLLKKVKIDFYNNTKANDPDSIRISHYNFNFNMQLNLLPKN